MFISYRKVLLLGREFKFRFDSQRDVFTREFLRNLVRTWTAPFECGFGLLFVRDRHVALPT